MNLYSHFLFFLRDKINMGQKNTTSKYFKKNEDLKNDIRNVLSNLTKININNEESLKNLMYVLDILMVRCRKRLYMYFTNELEMMRDEAQIKLHIMSPKFFYHKEPIPELVPPSYESINLNIVDEITLNTKDLFLERHISIVKYLEWYIEKY
jgi:hypothetical protein